MLMKDKLLKIINHYGINSQLKKFNEESYELIEAITDFEYNKYITYGDFFFEHLIEEFADVMVVLEQFKIYYNLDNQRIIEIMEKKIDRQLERIKKGN